MFEVAQATTWKKDAIASIKGKEEEAVALRDSVVKPVPVQASKHVPISAPSDSDDDVAAMFKPRKKAKH